MLFIVFVFDLDLNFDTIKDELEFLTNLRLL